MRGDKVRRRRTPACREQSEFLGHASSNLEDAVVIDSVRRQTRRQTSVCCLFLSAALSRRFTVCRTIRDSSRQLATLIFSFKSSRPDDDNVDDSRGASTPTSTPRTSSHNGEVLGGQPSEHDRIGANPRSVLVEALSRAIRDAAAVGDLVAARVAHRALGELLGDVSETETAPVIDLGERRRRDR